MWGQPPSAVLRAKLDRLPVPFLSRRRNKIFEKARLQAAPLQSNKDIGFSLPGTLGRYHQIVQPLVRTLAWLLCVIYSTIPAFWLLIHPHAEYWRSRRQSPYKILLPLWIGMWILVAAITAPWRQIVLYQNKLTWIPAVLLFCAGLILYKLSHARFTLQQLGGLPEIMRGHSHQQLITTGIRARTRHPVYLAHLCEMLAWSTATGLGVCWTLTAWAILTGVVMIRMEDKELEKRFGEVYRQYQSAVPPLVPKIKK
jgi:protein-S-isoprenylcysteine O-methyltransferase Ste14